MLAVRLLVIEGLEQRLEVALASLEREHRAGELREVAQVADSLERRPRDDRWELEVHCAIHFGKDVHGSLQAADHMLELGGATIHTVDTRWDQQAGLEEPITHRGMPLDQRRLSHVRSPWRCTTDWHCVR